MDSCLFTRAHAHVTRTGIIAATATILEVWWPLLLQERAHCMPLTSGHDRQQRTIVSNATKCVEGAEDTAAGSVRVLDLAAGSGEATLAFSSWWSSPLAGSRSRRARGPASSPEFRTETTTDGRRGKEEELPHSSLSLPPSPLSQRLSLEIDACDPYTHEAYFQRIGKTAERHSFQVNAETPMRTVDRSE